MAENPKVHSKGMQHGMPRKPGAMANPTSEVKLPGPREMTHSNPYEDVPKATHHMPGAKRG